MSVAATIESALRDAFSPTHLAVVNESYMHNVPPGSESHFKVVLVAGSFEGQSLVARHRAVNAVVDMSKHGIHALALHTFAPGEWSAQQGGDSTQSPNCLGGNGK